MRPRFVRAQDSIPANSLIIDCGVAGTETYSHWKDSPVTPKELIADTSTEILLNAARDPARWLNGFDYAVNDHVDADGLLAVAVACRPQELLPYRELLIAAAESGDFSEWTTEAGFRLMLLLHQLMRDAALSGEGWEQRLFDLVTATMPSIIAYANKPDVERDAQIARVIAVQQALLTKTGFTIRQSETLLGVEWFSVHGHTDSFRVVDRADDLPEWSLSSITTPQQFQLLARHTNKGIIFQLDAPRHSWARTVKRPVIAWPDLTEAAQILQQQENSLGRWITVPASRQYGYVCLLACVSDTKLTPSSLSFDQVWRALSVVF
jgi:hypothetical protein